MERIVLDASAMLCLLDGDPGSEIVEEVLTDGLTGKAEIYLSAVNWGEIYYASWRKGGEQQARRSIAKVSQLPIEVVAVDQAQAKLAAEIKAQHKLPYVDALAASLAKLTGSRLITLDSDFRAVKDQVTVQFL